MTPLASREELEYMQECSGSLLASVTRMVFVFGVDWSRVTVVMMQ